MTLRVIIDWLTGGDLDAAERSDDLKIVSKGVRGNVLAQLKRLMSKDRFAENSAAGDRAATRLQKMVSDGR